MTQKSEGPDQLVTGGPQNLPARTGLDDVEDSATAAARKQDRADLDLIIGENLGTLGDPERDDEHNRLYRNFLVRLLHEPLQAVGIAPPPSASSEFRVLVMFRDGPASVPYFIDTDFVAAFQLANRLRRLNQMPVPVWPCMGSGGQPMSQAEILAPLDFAQLIAPRSIWDRTLFDHLASRFDYILQITEAPASMWTVLIYYAPGKHQPSELGVRGELGFPGWTHEPVPLAEAVHMATNAAAILAQRGVRHVAVFSPGAGWLARVRALRSSAALLSGGVA